MVLYKHAMKWQPLPKRVSQSFSSETTSQWGQWHNSRGFPGNHDLALNVGSEDSRPQAKGNWLTLPQPAKSQRSGKNPAPETTTHPAARGTGSWMKGRNASG